MAFLEGPGIEPTVEDMLGLLYVRASDWEGGRSDDTMPEHIAGAYTVNNRLGAECIQIVNWQTLDHVDIVRPTLDSPNASALTTSYLTDEKVLYRLTATDLFRQPYLITMYHGEKIGVSELCFDIFAGKIAIWGEAAVADEEQDDEAENSNILVISTLERSGTPSYAFTRRVLTVWFSYHC